MQEVKKQEGISNYPVEKAISNEEKLIYRPKQAILSDDFEIIYDSEFTTEELEQIAYTTEISDIRAKAKELIGDREYTNNKYGIEV
jgi:hypothetical protein